MGVNQFVSFASSVGANVQAIASYIASAARSLGFSAGIAPSDACNRAWRQGANMASALGEVIINRTSDDANDDGDITTLRNSLLKAIRAASPPIPSSVTLYNSSTSITVPANVWVVDIEVIGGGGSGGGCANGQGGGGGGAGGYARGRFNVVPGNVLTLTASGTTAAGGAPGGGPGSNGNIGSDASVVCVAAGINITAGGGGAGNGSVPAGNAAGGAPGTGSGGHITSYGGYGTDGQSASGVFGGDGGASFFGGGGRGASGGGTPSNALAHGSGGGGSYTTASGGGSGGFPAIIIRY